MRIYAYIPRLGVRINIQNILHKRDPNTGLPILYFDCDKKFEETIRDEKVIFVNRYGKEYFRADRAWLAFRYYESDFYDSPAQKRKVAFEVNNICIMHYGHIGNDFMLRILSDTCNTKYKIEAPKPVPPKEEPKKNWPYKYPIEYMKYIWLEMKLSRRHWYIREWYRICKIRAPLWHFLQIYDKSHKHKYTDIPKQIESHAPT